MKQNKTTDPKILALQKQAKAAYRAYYRILDGYSCGAALAENISKDLYSIKIRFNKLCDRMAKLDPTCPRFRL